MIVSRTVPLATKPFRGIVKSVNNLVNSTAIVSHQFVQTTVCLGQQAGGGGGGGAGGDGGGEGWEGR